MSDLSNESAELSGADDTALGESFSIGDLPSEFGDLKDLDNFGFLDDDDDDTPASDGAASEDTPPASVAGADNAKTSKEGAAAPEEKQPEVPADPQAAEKLEAYERLDTALRENPAQAVKAIFAGMSAADRQSLAAELAGGSQSAPQESATERFKVDNYEPQGEMEEALAKRWNSIEAIPAIIDAQNDADRRMEQGFSAFVPHVTDANIASQIALAKVEAICEALGIELPDPDSAAIIKTLQGGKTTYRDAVRQSTNYKGQVDAHKQTRRPRPETPGGGPRNVEKIAPGTDAVAIARRLGVLPPR